MEDQIRIEYIPLSRAEKWDWEENPKLSDLQAICESIGRYGFVDPPKFDSALQRFVYGNHRVKALVALNKNAQPMPRGIIADPKSGEWLVPVKFGVDQKNVDEAKSLALDHNSITLLGGDFTAFDLEKLWNPDEYEKILQELRDADALPISVASDDLDALISASTNEKEKSSDPSVEVARKVVCPHCGKKFELEAL